MKTQIKLKDVALLDTSAYSFKADFYICTRYKMLVLIALLSIEGSGEPARMPNRALAACMHTFWMYLISQTNVYTVYNSGPLKYISPYATSTKAIYIICMM